MDAAGTMSLRQGRKGRATLVANGLGALAMMLALAGIAPAVRAETVVLRNGQRLRVTGYESAGGVMRLTVPGGYVQVRAEEVEKIEPEDYFPVAATTAASEKPYEDLIRAAAQKHGVDADLIYGIIAAESNFDRKAVSRKGAQGLMQLMPATAKELDVRDVFDPAENIDAGTSYLKSLLSRYQNDLRLTLAAYNAGPERVEQYRGVPPFAETREYLNRVIRHYNARKQRRN